VPRIKQKIPAFDEIDIAVVGVCPSSRPGLSDCEPVPAISEVLMACHHSHVANGKVVLTSKVLAKMFIWNSPKLHVPLFMCNAFLMNHMPFFGTPLFMRLVPLFLMGFVIFFFAHFFSFSVLVLSNTRYGHS
jgi:hypothetical protein